MKDRSGGGSFHLGRGSIARGPVEVRNQKIKAKAKLPKHFAVLVLDAYTEGKKFPRPCRVPAAEFQSAPNRK